MKTILDYDLLFLIGADTWTEFDKKNMITKFSQALGNYLYQQFSPSLNDQSLNEFQQLTQQVDFNQTDLTNFFQAKIPQFSQQLTQHLIQFKTVFVTSVYQQKTQEVKNQPQLKIWKDITAASLANNWEKVANLLKS